MTWLIITGAWLAVAMAMACVLGRAIHLADERRLSRQMGIDDDDTLVTVGARVVMADWSSTLHP